MAVPFMYPTITSCLGGYDYYSSIPIPKLINALAVKDADILVEFNVFHDGDLKSEDERRIIIQDGRLSGEAPEPFKIQDQSAVWGPEPGFVEIAFKSENDLPVFTTKDPIAFYSVFSGLGKKTFFTDNTYKFGSPPVIDQIAMLGRYIDNYPIVHIDRSRDIGESFILINPYRQPVVYQILASDGQASKRNRVPARSARFFRFSDFVNDHEDEWLGQVQITANNRLITFTVKHSLSDPTLVSTHEHLDPFRTDPTHVPATQWLRNYIGEQLRSRGWM